MAIEVAMWFPILMLLLVAMVQFGKITYQYYQLKKNLFTIAQYISRQQGLDTCSLSSDVNVVAAINYAMTGGSDGSATSQFPTITSDMIEVTTECADSEGALGTCSTSGCDGDGLVGGQRPDYIVVALPSGYEVTPKIPYMTVESILLKPVVRIPFGGT